MDRKSWEDWKGVPDEEQITQSRQRVQNWFTRTAPVIRWDVVESPVGLLYLATSERGLCSVDFGVEEEAFLDRLDALARLERSAKALASAEAQLSEYFTGRRRRFELAVDLSQLTPFQQSVLQMTGTIQAGSVWTYHQVAEAIGRPNASRPVGTALAHNPVPIVIPCHRVVASDGTLGGYSAGAGLESKRLLLHMEGAQLAWMQVRRAQPAQKGAV
jgi:methylated-DNA-[protein]-cysteine S-methyltransferase